MRTQPQVRPLVAGLSAAICWMLVSAGPVHGQDAGRPSPPAPPAGAPLHLTLEEAIATARAHNRGLQIQTLKVTEPPARKGGGRVADVKELVQKLRNEAKVLP